jgi:hypothetical protein
MVTRESRAPKIEILERRNLLSGTAQSSIGASASLTHQPSSPTAFVAHLTLAVPTLTNDKASGVATVRFTHNGTEATISGNLSNISNPSAIILRLPTVKTPSTANTTTTTTPTDPAGHAVTSQVATTTTATDYQTVAVLIKPGSGSGPFRHVPFSLSINRFSLIGQLAGEPLTQLLKQTRLGNVSVVVETNNGVDPATSVAPGNVQTGEIQGTLLPMTSKKG